MVGPPGKGKEGGEGERREGSGREGKGGDVNEGEGVPECPNPELASLLYRGTILLNIESVPYWKKT